MSKEMATKIWYKNPFCGNSVGKLSFKIISYPREDINIKEKKKTIIQMSWRLQAGEVEDILVNT